MMLASLQVDGDKFVCLDDLLTGQPCLVCTGVNIVLCCTITSTMQVYSFGVSDDWEFEDSVARLGCSVLAFDHTVDQPAARGDHIRFRKVRLAQLFCIALYRAEVKAQVGLGRGPGLAPLSELLRQEGHQATTITLLKVY